MCSGGSCLIHHQNGKALGLKVPLIDVEVPTVEKCNCLLNGTATSTPKQCQASSFHLEADSVA